MGQHHMLMVAIPQAARAAVEPTETTHAAILLLASPATRTILASPRLGQQPPWPWWMLTTSRSARRSHECWPRHCQCSRSSTCGDDGSGRRPARGCRGRTSRSRKSRRGGHIGCCSGRRAMMSRPKLAGGPGVAAFRLGGDPLGLWGQVGRGANEPRGVLDPKGMRSVGGDACPSA